MNNFLRKSVVSIIAMMGVGIFDPSFASNSTTDEDRIVVEAWYNPYYVDNNWDSGWSGTDYGMWDASFDPSGGSGGADVPEASLVTVGCSGDSVSRETQAWLSYT